MLRSSLAIGVPVNAKNNAFGRAARIVNPKLPSWVRCASSTRTTMLPRVFRSDAAPANLWTVVKIRPRRSAAPRVSCNAFAVAGASSRGMWVVRNWSHALRTRSTRSATSTTVGFANTGSCSSCPAANTIASVFPDPCV